LKTDEAVANRNTIKLNPNNLQSVKPALRMQKLTPFFPEAAFE